MISILKLHWMYSLLQNEYSVSDVRIDSHALREMNKKIFLKHAQNLFTCRCTAFHSRSASTTSQVAKLTVVETNEDNEPG